MRNVEFVDPVSAGKAWVEQERLLAGLQGFLPIQVDDA